MGLSILSLQRFMGRRERGGEFMNESAHSTPHRPLARASKRQPLRPPDRSRPARPSVSASASRARAEGRSRFQRGREGSGRDACRISGDEAGGRCNGGSSQRSGENGGRSRQNTYFTSPSGQWAGLVRHSYRCGHLSLAIAGNRMGLSQCSRAPLAKKASGHRPSGEVGKCG